MIARVDPTAFRFALVFLLIYIVSAAYGQQIKGTVTDANGKWLDGATIQISSVDNDQPLIATAIVYNGQFEIGVIETGSCKITVRHIGYLTYQKVIDASTPSALSIVMDEDILGLDEIVVTGTFIPDISQRSSLSISTLGKEDIRKTGVSGIARLLQNEPGVYADPSAGEVFTRVYSRGISISAEDDLGWYYVSLQEDGLPITAVQFASFAPDLFYRVDAGVDRVEALRGGSSAITGINSPGGIYNFISKPFGDKTRINLEQDIGVHANGNTFWKTDLFLNGSLGSKWNFSAGGHYRKDNGARTTNYERFSEGGQLRFNLMKRMRKGSITFRTKYLNDYVNRWTGVTAENWDNPVAAYDQSLLFTAQMIPALTASIPDGTGKSYNFDPSRGINTREKSIGLWYDTWLGQWKLNNEIKYSAKSANWQTSLSKAKVDLDSPLPYFISGAGFPIGEVVFRSATTHAELARIDNSGVLDPVNPSFQYLSPSRLPFDAILGTAAWYKNDENNELMDQLSMSREFDRHRIRFGLFYAHSRVSTSTRASFAYTTYESQPSLMKVTLENPGTDVIHLSDDNGLSNYNGLFFEQGVAEVNQLHLFAQDKIEVSDKLKIDMGIRLETHQHEGSKARSQPLTQQGGLDQNVLTDYDNTTLIPTGVNDEFNFSYTTFAYSLGLSYEAGENLNFFGRFSKGNKTPELDYYFNNFPNAEIPSPGAVQKVYQAEAGIKWTRKKFSVVPVVFWSTLADVATSNFVFDQQNNTIFYTPLQYNSTRTIGLEIESKYLISQSFAIRMNGTFQDPRSVRYNVYNANGTTDTSDDETISHNGNELPFNPKVLLHVSPELRLKKINAFLTWTYMGERYGNVANAFKLPAYQMVDAGISYTIRQNISVSLHVQNVFNAEGIMNFYGPDFLGASKDDASHDFIQNNPQSGFVVVPVLARMLGILVNYSF